MEKSLKAGVAPEHGENLEQVRQRFRNWRENRKRGEHIPPVLWAAAVRMARDHGLERIAGELRVDSFSLKRRLERAGNAVAPGRPLIDTQFVELFSALAPAIPECVIEMENRHSGKMRIELSGNGVTGLAGLCSAFWGAP